MNHAASRDRASAGAPRGSQVAHVSARLVATRSALASRRCTASSSSKSVAVPKYTSSGVRPLQDAAQTTRVDQRVDLAVGVLDARVAGDCGRVACDALRVQSQRADREVSEVEIGDHVAHGVNFVGGELGGASLRAAGPVIEVAGGLRPTLEAEYANAQLPGVIVEHVSAHHLSYPATQPAPGGRARHAESLSRVEITSAADDVGGDDPEQANGLAGEMNLEITTASGRAAQSGVDCSGSSHLLRAARVGAIELFGA